MLERWQRGCSGLLEVDPARPIWLVPVRGTGTIGGEVLEAGTAWLVEGDTELVIDGDADLLVSYPGHGVRSFDALRFDPPRLVPLQRRRYRDAPLRKAG